MDNKTNNKTKILVLIPAHNEEKNIERVIRRVRDQIDAQIVVIDDGSKDETAKIASSAGAKVISLPVNMGYGVALQTGYKYAVYEGYDWVIQLDADGQHDPSSIADFLKEIQTGQTDAIIGSRFLGTLNYEISKARRLGMIIFSKLASFISRRTITDPTSGFQALNRNVLELCISDIYPVDYPDADFIIMLHYERFRIKEIPVTMNANKENRSMHGGVLKPAYYVFKMCLSIVVTYLRELDKRRMSKKGTRHPE